MQSGYMTHWPKLGREDRIAPGIPEPPDRDGGWISVDERLPEKETSVLVWATWDGSDDQILVADWRDWEGAPIWHDSMNGEYRIHGITHWMPLPEAPK